MKKIKLKIKGMHCKSCEMLIADALEEIGVSNSRIDSNSGEAEIEFDDNKLSEQEIKETIKKEGYKIE